MRTITYIMLSFLMIFSLLAGITGCKGKQKETAAVAATSIVYTCSMHTQIIRDKPGDCPICGMTLIKKIISGNNGSTTGLDQVLQPTNQYVVSAIPVTAIHWDNGPATIDALGSVDYDTREEGTIASKISGRIEKLYIRYRYQQVEKGQKIMEVYSPEILTAEENLLLVLKQDASNLTLIDAAKQRLQMLGMEAEQIASVIKSDSPLITVSVFSKYTGHIHEAGNSRMNTPQNGMKDIATITEELPLKEGMYIKKGENVFAVYNPSKVWIVLNIFGADQSMVHTGNEVTLTPETHPDQSFHAKINFIEPFFRKDAKTVTARVYFNNTALHIPVGTQVKVKIKTAPIQAYWLNTESVISLGLDKVVFLKQDGGFKVHQIHTGIISNNIIQVLDGLTPKDSVAAHAQYLMDSESFIQLKK